MSDAVTVLPIGLDAVSFLLLINDCSTSDYQVKLAKALQWFQIKIDNIQLTGAGKFLHCNYVPMLTTSKSLKVM